MFAVEYMKGWCNYSDHKLSYQPGISAHIVLGLLPRLYCHQVANNDVLHTYATTRWHTTPYMLPLGGTQ